MKISFFSIIGLLILLLFGNQEAKGFQGHSEIMKKEISADVVEAVKMTNIRASDSLINIFVKLGKSQANDFKQVYARVPKKTRIERLAKYFKAKANTAGIPAYVTKSDLNDFHWGYIEKDIRYTALQLDSPKRAALVKVELDNKHYTFLTKGEGISPGATILMPKVYGKETNDVSATFELGGMKALWTGNPNLATMKIESAHTSKGCVFFVNSLPKQASVYFNKKKWYQSTNTSCVRSPGLWNVTIHRDGYKEWSQERELSAGETWTINAQLIKK